MLFACFIVLAAVLTIVCFIWHNVVLALAGMLGWLILGVWILMGNITGLGVSTTLGQMLGFLFVLMTFAPLTRYISRVGKVQITHNEDGKMFSLWEKAPTKTVNRAQQVRDNRRAQIRSVIDRTSSIKPRVK